MPQVGDRFFYLFESQICEVEVLRNKSHTTSCFLRRPGTGFMTEFWTDVSRECFYLTIDEALEDMKKKVKYLPQVENKELAA